MVVISSTFSAPATGILCQTPATKMLINAQELGTATLYITEKEVIWGGGQLQSGGPAPTISLAYTQIAIHAVQREPLPALYLVLNYELRVPQLADCDGEAVFEEDDDDDFNGESATITQLRFVPEDEGALAVMYQAMNEGQALNPDPEDDDYMDGEDVDDGEEESFEDAEEAAPEEAAARLRGLRLDHVNGAQFEDADEPIDE